jgi:hypothetical protein
LGEAKGVKEGEGRSGGCNAEGFGHKGAHWNLRRCGC